MRQPSIVQHATSCTLVSSSPQQRNCRDRRSESQKTKYTPVILHSAIHGKALQFMLSNFLPGLSGLGHGFQSNPPKFGDSSIGPCLQCFSMLLGNPSEQAAKISFHLFGLWCKLRGSLHEEGSLGVVCLQTRQLSLGSCIDSCN